MGRGNGVWSGESLHEKKNGLGFIRSHLWESKKRTLRIFYWTRVLFCALKLKQLHTQFDLSLFDMLFTHHSGPTSFRARKKTSTHEADRPIPLIFIFKSHLCFWNERRYGRSLRHVGENCNWGGGGEGMNRVRKSSRVNPINREIREMISKVFRGGVQKGKKKHECMSPIFFLRLIFLPDVGRRNGKNIPRPWHLFSLFSSSNLRRKKHSRNEKQSKSALSVN